LYIRLLFKYTYIGRVKMSMDHRPVDGMCMDCKYYYDGRVPDSIGCGECRYGPPSAIKHESSIINGYYSGKFPLVSEYEWCWKFTQREMK
jgi:Zn finger protein HypA/HybF involved in hydrogenase expression